MKRAKANRDYDVIITVTNDIAYDQRIIKMASSLAKVGKRVLVLGRRMENRAQYRDSFAFDTLLQECFFTKGPGFYLEYNIRSLWACLNRRYDTHYSVDLDTILAGSILRSIGRCRLLCFDAHELFEDTPELAHTKAKRWIWSVLGRICIVATDVRITVNQSLQNILESKYGTPFHVIYNTPLKNRSTKGRPRQDAEVERRLPSDKKVILYQGAVNQGRGLEVAIEAMHLLGEHHHLVIAGGGDVLEDIRALVYREGLTERVSLLGMIAPERLRKITPQAWIGINLLDESSENYYYSLANRFFDLMHAGIPSINMAFPEYVSILNKYACGLTISHLCVQEYSSAVLALEQDPDRYDNMVLAAKEATEIYNWESQEKKLLSLFI